MEGRRRRGGARNEGRTDQAWIMTGEGLKVEILEDKSQAIPIAPPRALLRGREA